MTFLTRSAAGTSTTAGDSQTGTRQPRSICRTDQLSYDLFKKRYETDIEGFQIYRWLLLPLNQLGRLCTL